MIASLTAKNLKSARIAQERVKGRRNRMLVLAGTGVSRGMMRSGSAGLCDWHKFVSFLFDSLATGPVKSRLKRYVEQLENQAAVSEILGMAHMIRQKLEIDGEWESAISRFSINLRRDQNEDSMWWKLISKATESANALDLPLFLTTNYDPLLTDALQARSLVSQDNGQGFRFIKRSDETHLPPYLEQTVEVPLLWDMHRDGLIGSADAFVHHLHGAASAPSSIVLDPADYERVLRAGIASHIAESLLSRVLLVVGMGAGMHDRHLTGLWQKVSKSPSVLSQPTPCVYWVLPKEELKDRTMELARCLGKEELTQETWLEVVDLEDRDLTPDWLRCVLNIRTTEGVETR